MNGGTADILSSFDHIDDNREHAGKELQRILLQLSDKSAKILQRSCDKHLREVVAAGEKFRN